MSRRDAEEVGWTELKRTARCPSARRTVGGSDRKLCSRLGGKEEGALRGDPSCVAWGRECVRMLFPKLGRGVRGKGGVLGGGRR